VRVAKDLARQRLSEVDSMSVPSYCGFKRDILTHKARKRVLGVIITLFLQPCEKKIMNIAGRLLNIRR